MEHLFHHTITVYGTTARDEFNEETFGSGVDVVGRFHLVNKQIINDKGESVRADAMAYFPKTTTGLIIGGKVSFNSVNYRIISLVESINEVSDLHHYEAYLQRWS